MNFRLNVSAVLVLLLAWSQLSLSQVVKPSSDTLRILLVGNSFSQNATRFLPQIAKENGYVLILGHAELPACPTERHIQLALLNEQNPEDPKGKPYKGKSLKELLLQEKWDFVTMQQYSMYSSDYSTYEPYANDLLKYIQSYVANAKVVWHQTWAYRQDAKRFGRLGVDQDGKTVYAQNDRQMWDAISQNTDKLSKDLSISFIPVGEAFWVVRNSKKWAFEKDKSFDFSNPVKSAVPQDRNSLNIGWFWNKDTFTLDPNHANTAGCYLGGLVWYGFFFGESPKDVYYVPDGISNEFAAYLKTVAADVLKSNLKKKTK